MYTTYHINHTSINIFKTFWFQLILPLIFVTTFLTLFVFILQTRTPNRFVSIICDLLLESPLTDIEFSYGNTFLRDSYKAYVIFLGRETYGFVLEFSLIASVIVFVSRINNRFSHILAHQQCDFAVQVCIFAHVWINVLNLWPLNAFSMQLCHWTSLDDGVTSSMRAIIPFPSRIILYWFTLFLPFSKFVLPYPRAMSHNTYPSWYNALFFAYDFFFLSICNDRIKNTRW